MLMRIMSIHGFPIWYIFIHKWYLIYITKLPKKVVSVLAMHLKKYAQV